MKASKQFSTLILAAFTLVISACANKEAIKAEAPIAPSASAQQGLSSDNGANAQQSATPVASQAIATATVATPQKAAPATAVAEALEKIYFGYDSHTLSQGARDTLDRNFEKMRGDQSMRITIEGNCDERGSGEYNLALGERRAKAAKEYLVTRGIAVDRIAVVSYGNERPAVQGHDETAWAKNRRDEFVLVK